MDSSAPPTQPTLLQPVTQPQPTSKPEQSNPQSTLNFEQKFKQLMMQPKFSKQQLEVQAQEDAKKFQSLDSGLDDLFAKISQLTAMAEEKVEIVEVKQEEKVDDGTVEKVKVEEVVYQPVKHNPFAQVHKFPEIVLPAPLLQPQPEYPDDQILTMRHFELGKAVGQGKFGQVYQCRHRKTNMLFALKKIFKSTVAQYKMTQHLIQQILILNSLRHPNIIKQYACFTDAYHIFMIMQYINGVGLLKHLKSPPHEVSRILFQVLNAVKYLHDKKIVHRDIKPENILYEGGVVKLCDFGWATSWKDGKLGSFCGTLDYLSPEMAGKGQYDGSVDVWAVGVLAYELLTGKVPIKDADKERQIDKIAECDESKIVYPEEMEEQVRDFVHRFLRKEPSQRITLEQALKHPFITKYNNGQQENIEGVDVGEIQSVLDD